MMAIYYTKTNLWTGVGLRKSLGGRRGVWAEVLHIRLEGRGNGGPVARGKARTGVMVNRHDHVNPMLWGQLNVFKNESAIV